MSSNKTLSFDKSLWDSNDITGTSSTELTVILPVPVLVIFFSATFTEYWNWSVPKKLLLGTYVIEPFALKVKTPEETFDVIA